MDYHACNKWVKDQSPGWGLMAEALQTIRSQAATIHSIEQIKRTVHSQYLSQKGTVDALLETGKISVDVHDILSARLSENVQELQQVINSI